MTTVSYFALIYAATLWLSRFLLRYMEPEMFLDLPTDRKLHTVAKPRFGGIAFGLGIIIFGWFILNDHMQFTWYFLAAISMFILGAIDDYWSISWRIKLPTQILTGFLVWVQFIQEMPMITFFGYSISDNPIVVGALFIFWFVGIVNAVNLIDGMDGLAGGYIFLTSFFALLNSTRKCNSKGIAKGVSCYSLSSDRKTIMRSTHAPLQAAYPGAKIRNKSDEPSRT